MTTELTVYSQRLEGQVEVESFNFCSFFLHNVCFGLGAEALIWI